MATVRGQLLRVGTLVSGALVVLMLGLFLIGEGHNWLQRKVHYRIHFSRTNGLLVGAPVALTGVTVGSVVDIGFPRQKRAQYIDVKVEVARRVAYRIRENSVASIRTQGILGDKYIELSAGSPDAAPRKPGTVIPEIDPIDYEAVLGQSGDIVTNIVELTGSLRTILQAIDRGEGLLGAIVRNRERGELTFTDIQQAVRSVTEITAHMERIVASVERGEGLLGALVRDTDRAQGILESLTESAERLDEFTQRLSSARGLLPRLVEDDEVGERVLADLETAARELAEVSEKVNRSQGTLGLLVNDPTLYKETTAFVRTTRKSWTLRIYRGLQHLWPFGTEEVELAEPGDVGTPPAPAGEEEQALSSEGPPARGGRVRRARARR